MTSPREQTVSVVVPTFNRVARLGRVVHALESQSFPRARFEVLVISDGSTDGTREYMTQLDSPLAIRFLEQPNQGPAVARNTGLHHAQGDIVVFLDDDVVPSPALIDEHIARHTEGNIVVLGPMLTPPDFRMQAWVRWEQAMLMKQYDDMQRGRWEPTARQFYTGNSSVARAPLLEAGGFDPRFRRAEDVELAYRLADRGLRFLFCPEAIGWHYAERSFGAWLEIPYLYGRNDVIFARDKGQNWLLLKIFEEYHRRHVFVRALTRWCLDRPTRSSLAFALLRQAARVPALSRTAYSGIFNLRNYQGLADELGGGERFFERASAARPAVS